MDLANKTKRLFLYTLLVASVFVPTSCDNEEPTNPNEYVNDWILRNMQFWYYWNTTISADPDKGLEHDAFFESLLHSQDRFSWIQEDFKELLNSLQGINKEVGFEFVLYLEDEFTRSVIGQILYVKPNSPAAVAKLKRGDMIVKINDKKLSLDNYKELLAEMGEPFSMAYKPLDIDMELFGVEKKISLFPVEYTENPNYLHSVFTVDDHKVGYFMYNFFATGPTSTSNVYNDEMDQVFAGFKSQGITDLVIDLRYNNGGAESATLNLASLIVPNVSKSWVFAKRQYNEGVTKAIKEDPDLGESFLKVMFKEKTQNVGSLLNNARVYILTGPRSASASELLINGLRPYMDVFLIGSKTVGKNMGSISLFEENDPKNTWGMQPLVTRSFNSLDQSDYESGFAPQIPDSDNSIFLFPLGNPRERLLSLALNQIGKLPLPGRQYEPHWGEPVGQSLDAKRRANILSIEPILYREE